MEQQQQLCAEVETNCIFTDPSVHQGAGIPEAVHRQADTPHPKSLRTAAMATYNNQNRLQHEKDSQIRHGGIMVQETEKLKF